LKQAGQNWYADKTFELGAALAYYAVFAVSPILVITLGIAGLIFGSAAAHGHLYAQLERALGSTVARAVDQTLQYTQQRGSGALATAISVGVLLVAAIGLFGQLQSALNTIWKVQPKPGRGVWGVVRDRFWSFLAVLGVSFLPLAAMLANIVLSSLEHILPAELRTSSLAVWWLINAAVLLVILTVAFAVLYAILPDADLGWRHVWPGAAFSAMLFVVGNYLIGLYLRWSGVTSAYGAAGSLVVILLWVYYSAQVMLFGAEFTQAYQRESQES
jgi:membrane protein